MALSYMIKKSCISQKSDTINIEELLWVEDVILHYTKGVLLIQKSLIYLSNSRYNK